MSNDSPRLPVPVQKAITGARRPFEKISGQEGNLVRWEKESMFAMQALRSALEGDPLFFGVSILCVLGSVAVTILDLLVACLQAYILTFLTAMFLGLYVEPSH